MGFHDGSITLITMEAPRESRGFAFQERGNKIQVDHDRPQRNERMKSNDHIERRITSFMREHEQMDQRFQGFDVKPCPILNRIR